jgi:hypothetical protein
MEDESLFAMTFHDPANLYATCLEMLNEDGEPLERSRKLGLRFARMVVQAGQPLLLAFGQQLVTLTRQQFCKCIDILKYDPAGKSTPVEIDMWNGYPIDTHPVVNILAEAGFSCEKGTMRWPTKKTIKKPQPSNEQPVFLPYHRDPPPRQYGPEWTISRTPESMRPIMAKVLPVLQEIFSREHWELLWEADWPSAAYRGIKCLRAVVRPNFLEITIRPPGNTDFGRVYKIWGWGRLMRPEDVNEAYINDLLHRRECAEASIDRYLAKKK